MVNIATGFSLYLVQIQKNYYYIYLILNLYNIKEMFCGINKQTINQQNDKVKKISNYLFSYGDVLGSGNFSTVYSGVDQNTGKPVAIKVVKMSSLKSKVALKLLQNQISILKYLDHPNVIKCYDQLTSINNCYIVTQVCENGDLDTQLKKKVKFQEREISKWIYEIVKGLQYLEANSIIHRDLKVANIFLNKNGTAKIADFGFAIKSKTKFKDINIGSPIYMSPEGLIHNQYGPKTDVWSLGILIYQLLHGDTPLGGCNTQEELKKKILEPVVFRVKASYQIKQFVQLCMKVRQVDRLSISQLTQTSYFKKISNQIQGTKIFKPYVSGFSSTYNSTNMSNSNSHKFQLNKEISYDTAVAFLHYCRLLHKTCKKVNSQILSQWLLIVSQQLKKAKISRSHSQKQHYNKLLEVISEYHNKYQKEHQNLRFDISLNQVISECQKLQKKVEAKNNIYVLLKESQMIRKCQQADKMQHFGKNSQAKTYLQNKN